MIGAPVAVCSASGALVGGTVVGGTVVGVTVVGGTVVVAAIVDGGVVAGSEVTATVVAADVATAAIVDGGMEEDVAEATPVLVSLLLHAAGTVTEMTDNNTKENLTDLTERLMALPPVQP